MMSSPEKSLDHNWLFFLCREPSPEPSGLPKEYSIEMWKPRSGRFVPTGLPVMPFAVWSAFHYLRVFANRDYALLLIRFCGHLVHRSVITPGYFRFPFMERKDLQIGDTWTHDDHRGKGLATFALRHITRCCGSGRRYWYVVSRDNASSIRVAQKAGFECAGLEKRAPRARLNILGAFVLSNSLHLDAQEPLHE